MKIPITLNINGEDMTLEINPGHTLLEVLRNQAGFKSVHRSCEEGECGACTVLLNNEPHPLIKAFTDELGIQCGFCTPGMLMSAYALIDNSGQQELTDEEIRESIQGNLCRCTGYVNIVKSVKQAQKAKIAGEWW